MRRQQKRAASNIPEAAREEAVARGRFAGYAAEFGFSPAARSRIAAGVGPFTPPPWGKFEGLLAGR